VERLNTTIEVPPNSIVFTGSKPQGAILPELLSPDWVHMALVAGSSAGSCMLLEELQNWVSQAVGSNDPHFHCRAYLRHSDCCLNCAVDRVRMDSHSYLKVLIV
jgi:hypothetical protein